MEAFSLLKYWKGGGSGGGGGNAKLSAVSGVGTTPTTIVTAVDHHCAGEDDDSASDGDDDGPFFDLEFAVPADEEEEEELTEERQKVEEREIVDEIYEEVEERELELEQNMSFSPSDDLFFKGKVIQINGSDAAAALEMEEIIHSAAASAKSGQFPVPVSLVKSATKLRVFMLGLKRSKSESKQIPPEIHRRNKNSNGRKFTRVRLKMEDVKMPKMSLLSRAAPSNAVKTTQEDEKSVAESFSENNEEVAEKKNKREVVQKYLNLVKPLYVKVSNRKSSNNDDNESVAAAEEVVKNDIPAVETADSEAAVKGGRRRLSLKVIAKKHLGKSKSAVVHSMPSSNCSSSSNNSNNTTSLSKKSDDSLLQQQDGIQSAILHCKRSFNSSSSSEDGEETTSVLVRSASDPSHEKKSTREAEVAVEKEHQRNGVVIAGTG